MYTILNNYNISEDRCIHNGKHSKVYRTDRNSDQRPVILKMLKGEKESMYPTPDELARFSREYEIARKLQGTNGVIEVYELQDYENTLVIIMQDGGESLNNALSRGSFGQEEFLRLAIQITEALALIHSQNIIHKDINPSNIVKDQDTGQIKIIDFGISVEIPKEQPEPSHPERLEGTLDYISPEQTGRMNRAIDYRTDFYSLGATFYHMLIGQLPFDESEDLMRLIHAHLAKTPKSPYEIIGRESDTNSEGGPAGPALRIVSRIIMKLMEKGAEERYQTASGLKADLQYVLAHLTDQEMLSHFEIAGNDISERFEISQKLYGREKELDELLATFDRVSAGETELTLVSGHVGVGKSRLVNELRKPVVAKRGYFIAGKYEQYQNNTPYSAIIQAFKKLVSYLLAESPEQLAEWKEQLLEALGSNGQLILDVIPELKMIIGPQPEPDEVSPENARNRFLLTFQKFARAFASETHPLVIVLDDLQWADFPSLQLLEMLITSPEAQYMFFVGTYRDNKPEEIHSLLLTVNHLKEAGARIHEILLAPLSPEQINRLLADTLKAPESVCLPLAEFLLKRTDNGNPFFLKLYLHTLHQQELFALNPTQKCWEWDLTAIRKAEIPEDIIEIMEDNIQRLPEKSWKILALAACIGNRFDLHTLSTVRQTSQEETLDALRGALQNELIVPPNNSYKYAGRCQNASFQFPHDRVQQAAYSLIKEEHKPKLHLDIGQLLFKQSSSLDQEERLLEIVDHYNRGRELLKDQEEKFQLAQLNLKAGQKTKTDDPKRALEYLQIGIGLLDKKNWQEKYDLSLNLYTEAIEAAYLNGSIEELEQLALITLQQAKELKDKIRVYEIRIQAYIGQNDLLEAVNIGLDFLKKLGIQIPDSSNTSHILSMVSQMKMDLTEAQIEGLVNLPEMKDSYKLAIIRILASITSAVYFAAPQLFELVVLKVVNLSIKYGNTSHSALSYACYGAILSVKGEPEKGYRLGKFALHLLERLNAKTLSARATFAFNCLIRHWTEHVRETLQWFQDAHQTGVKTGDFEFAAQSAFLYCYSSYFSGKELKGLEDEMALYNDVIAYQLKQKTVLHMHKIYWQTVLNLMGQAEDSCRLVGKSYNEEAMLPSHIKANDTTTICHVYSNKLILCYLFQEYSQALEYAVMAEEYLVGLTATYSVPIFYYYDSLNRLALYPKVPKREQKAYLKKVSENQDMMKIWAEHAPINFLHKWYLVEAERARVLGKDAEAMGYYTQAIRGARKHEYVNEEALANELMAKFWLAKGMKPEARARMAKARYSYNKWGATAKVRHLEETYPELFDLHSQSLEKLFNPPSQRMKKPETTTIRSENLDLSTVKKFQEISNESENFEVFFTLLQILAKTAGAQKLVFIEHIDEKWVIQATFEERKVSNFLLAISLQDSELVPSSLINYVMNTQNDVILDDMTMDTQFETDTYVQIHQPKSILCLPIKSKGELIAILYLEHKQAARVFTPERTDMLKLLSWQIAILRENVRLYQQLEEQKNSLQQEVDKQTIELRKAKEVAEEASKAKSYFLSAMSHDLRTPLNAISGYAELLKQDNNLSDSYHEKIEIIHQSGKHFLTLIEDILDLAKIEAGKAEIKAEEFCFPEMLQTIIEMMRIHAQEKELFLRYEEESSLPHIVDGDETRLRQILLDLLGNAIKYTKHGSVTLRVRRDGLQEKSNTQRTARIRFEVEDTGIGIPKDKLAIIFQPFEQGGQTHGTGLGLAICQKYIRRMGSELYVNSTEGEGSLFWFDLEFLVKDGYQPHPSIIRKPQVIGFTGRKRTLLVVDDDTRKRGLLKDILMSSGFGIIEVATGRQAIEIVKEYQPDLILMDLCMPDLDGIETTSRIRRMSHINQMPIIGISASLERQQECSEAGCDAFLAKPLVLDELRECLRVHLGLEWIYEETVETENEPSQPSEALPLVMPPREQLMPLMGLAKAGFFDDIQDHAATLKELDAEFIPFATKIEQFAKAFQDQQILELINSSLQGGT